MNEQQMEMDLQCTSVQEVLGIDTESDARWMDIQAGDLDIEMMEQEVTRWEWDSIKEIRDSEKRQSMAMGE